MATEHDEYVMGLKRGHDLDVQSTAAEHNDRITFIKKEHAEAFANLEAKDQEHAEDMLASHEAVLAQTQEKHAGALAELQADNTTNLETLRAEHPRPFRGCRTCTTRRWTRCRGTAPAS